MIDCVYVAASAHDARFTRACVASIRYFHPELRIRLLAGGAVDASLERELAHDWDVEPAPFRRGDYGWGFVKLEPLFGKDAERFLVLDSDTVLAGPVAGLWRDGEFLVDDEQQTDSDARRLAYDWDRLRTIHPSSRRPAFVFNSGQWFGTAGIVRRQDFDRWVAWTMPRALRHPDCFMPGDQGVLNLVLNEGDAGGRFRVARRRIMQWPGHGMAGIDAAAVAARTAPPVIVHWAGMKRLRMGAMVGGDVLRFFEGQYYAAKSAGALRRHARATRSVVHGAARAGRVFVKLSARRLAAARRS
jgi:hypothetical protein